MNIFHTRKYKFDTARLYDAKNLPFLSAFILCIVYLSNMLLVHCIAMYPQHE